MPDGSPGGATFTVDGADLHVDVGRLIALAALRKSDAVAPIYGCTACETICSRVGKCSCCDRAFAGAMFNSGNRGVNGRRLTHVLVPADQLATALATLRAEAV